MNLKAEEIDNSVSKTKKKRNQGSTGFFVFVDYLYALIFLSRMIVWSLGIFYCYCCMCPPLPASGIKVGSVSWVCLIDSYGFIIVE